jgi:hypothetical protein
MYDLSARKYRQTKVPDSPKNLVKSLTYSSLSHISKYANRINFVVLVQNSRA